MRRFLIPLILAVSTFARESSAQTFYTDAHSVLVDAIKNGSASGVMGGKIAELFARNFSGGGSVLVDATVIESFPQEGCKRLSVIYTKKNVITPQGRTDARLDTKINYCLDGRAPQNLEN